MQAGCSAPELPGERVPPSGRQSPRWRYRSLVVAPVSVTPGCRQVECFSTQLVARRLSYGMVVLRSETCHTMRHSVPAYQGKALFAFVNTIHSSVVKGGCARFVVAFMGKGAIGSRGALSLVALRVCACACAGHGGMLPRRHACLVDVDLSGYPRLQPRRLLALSLSDSRSAFATSTVRVRTLESFGCAPGFLFEVCPACMVLTGVLRQRCGY